ncbi:MAG: hypothetical protein WA304_14435 [Candidatus Cybelea sp.]
MRCIAKRAAISHFGKQLNNEPLEKLGCRCLDFCEELLFSVLSKLRVSVSEALQRRSCGVSALLSFAYDLYTLENYSLLPKRLVKRLQHTDQFQGARYETYVAAAFVRAGFVVTPEDERDVTSSHCEFTAVNAATGEAYSVEAKSRHRAGYLGRPGAPTPLREIQGDARRLLISGLRKEANHERVVFIDVNVPPADSSVFVTEWFDKIASQMKEL